MKIKVGRYQLGVRMVDLFVLPGDSGGSLSCVPAGGVGAIIVGIDYQSWRQVVSVACHEILEMACADLNIRYRPHPDFADGGDGYVFFMDHSQFSEAIARTGWMLADCLPDLSDAYRRHGPNALKKKRRKRK